MGACALDVAASALGGIGLGDFGLGDFGLGDFGLRPSCRDTVWAERPRSKPTGVLAR
jgi:hypothetical protein